MDTTRTRTAAELLAMGSDAPYELIQGELGSVSLSSYKSNVVLGLGNIYMEIRLFVRAHRLGYVSIVEAGYLLESGPDTVVAPDIGFVARQHMLDPIPERGFLPVRPDLAVEVISPSDERADIARKQALYERVGVPLVWWIDPRKETATVHRPGKPVRQFDRTENLDGGDILPGFSLKLSDIFDQS